MRDLAKAREQLDRFHEQDLPRFTRWFNKQFGALLTEVRETSQQLNEKQQTLFEIQSEVVLSGVSPAQAYQRVMHRHNWETNRPTNRPRRPGRRRRMDQRSSRQARSILNIWKARTVGLSTFRTN